MSFSLGVLNPFASQFYENYIRKNTDGVSLTFLTLWVVGDILNLIGVILENLLFTMVRLKSRGVEYIYRLTR